jgi:aspartate aminotransferase
MNLSDRILSVKPSPTLAVTALANQMKAQGIDVIGFGSGEPDFDTPENIKEAARKAIDSGKTRYTPAGGIPELKAAIAEKFKRDNDLDYSINQVTVNCGGKHSFYNLMQVLLNPGEQVIIPAPYWVSYTAMTQLAGGEPVILETDESTGFKITPEQLEKNLTDKVKAFVLNSPSNPTGTGYTFEELQALGEVLKGRDIVLVSDDIYESIIYEGFRFSNLAQVSSELKEKTIVLNGVSKTYSMTGWRIGYMAGDRDIISKVETLQSQSTSNPTSISQWAALEAITGPRDAVEEMRTAFDRRRSLVVNGLNAIDELECRDPEGAFYVFPSIEKIFSFPGWKDIEKHFPDYEYQSTRFSSYLLEEVNVAVVPGIAFGNDNHIRMSFATSDENIAQGVERIASAIERLR